MAGIIWDFFGYRANDQSNEAVSTAWSKTCPYLKEKCEKTLNDGEISGVCAIKPVKSGPVICCPIRLYADDYKVLSAVTRKAFGDDLELVPGRGASATAKQRSRSLVAVFGKRWGGELRLPKKGGKGSYFVDWVLALLDHNGELIEFVAVEVQTIDTTGNYRNGRLALLDRPREIVKTTAGLNWENVSKRILPQIIYKGQILQREELCKKGLFFVCPSEVYERIAARLGGKDKLVKYPLQPASVTFVINDYDHSASQTDGRSVPLQVRDMHSTTVYRVQEAFNNVTLPEENVYKHAILEALTKN